MWRGARLNEDARQTRSLVTGSVSSQRSAVGARLIVFGCRAGRVLASVLSRDQWLIADGSKRQNSVGRELDRCVSREATSERRIRDAIYRSGITVTIHNE